MLKPWIVIIGTLFFIGLALLAYWYATQDAEPKPTPAQHETGVLRVEV